jgi:hypothetical protein
LQTYHNLQWFTPCNTQPYIQQQKHPVVTKLVDKDVLEKMGAKQIVASDMPTEGQMTNK